jgi:hypothetical protein
VIEVGEDTQQRALAAATGADQRDELAGRDVEVEIVDDRAIAEAARQPAHTNGGLRFDGGRCVRNGEGMSGQGNGHDVRFR